MIEHIPELMESGISSFKIEGRMKSAYYAAVCANTYRMAIDAYRADSKGYRYDERWKKELESVSHREYCTGYWFDATGENAQTVTEPGYLKEKGYLAVVESYDEATGRATLVQKNKMLDRSTVELLTPGSVGTAFFVEGMQNEAGEAIESCPHPQMRFSIASSCPLRAGDILRGI